MSLVPQIADAVGAGIPVVASGGIMDGRGIAAALALGAQGVSLGTRFLGSAESGAADVYAEALARHARRRAPSSPTSSRDARRAGSATASSTRSLEADPGTLGWGAQARARRRSAPRRRRAGPRRHPADAGRRGRRAERRRASPRRRSSRASCARPSGVAWLAEQRRPEAVFPRQLEYLVALERERHFGRAARACHVSQPTLSTGLRKLEAELGVPLVRRGQRFEGFTREGERVVLWAHRILADYDGLGHELSQIRGGLEGTLRIGAIPTSLPTISLVTSPFCERHPLMHVEVLSLSSREIERRLDAFELDAGLTYLDNEPLGNVRTVPLYRERYVLLCAVDGPFAGRSTVDWAEAATVPLCLLTPDMQNRRILNDNFAAAGAVATPTVETNSISTLCSHVRRGWSSVMAHAWLSLFGVPEAMRAVPLVGPEVTHSIGIVVPDVEPLPPLADGARRAVRGASTSRASSTASSSGSSQQAQAIDPVYRQVRGFDWRRIGRGCMLRDHDHPPGRISAYAQRPSHNAARPLRRNAPARLLGRGARRRRGGLQPRASDRHDRVVRDVLVLQGIERDELPGAEVRAPGDGLEQHRLM